MMPDIREPVTVGTKVSTTLYSRGVGYIYVIHGKAKPDTVRSLGRGVGQIGGSASYDIVFADASYSLRLPECILHGVQWKIYPRAQGFADTAMLAGLRAHADAVQAENERIAAEEEAAFNAEIEALRVDPAYAGLVQGDDGSGTVAAKNIRLLLKKAFPGIRFSVRKTDYGALVVRSEVRIDRAEIEAIRERFRSGCFNLESDCHTDHYTPWMRVFGHATYISV